MKKAFTYNASHRGYVFRLRNLSTPPRDLPNISAISFAVMSYLFFKMNILSSLLMFPFFGIVSSSLGVSFSSCSPQTTENRRLETPLYRRADCSAPCSRSP